jgi:hypothetical protein
MAEAADQGGLFLVFGLCPGLLLLDWLLSRPDTARRRDRARGRWLTEPTLDFVPDPRCPCRKSGREVSEESLEAFSRGPS